MTRHHPQEVNPNPAVTGGAGRVLRSPMPRLPVDPLRRRALARVGLAALALVALARGLALPVGFRGRGEAGAWARPAGPGAPAAFLLFGAVSTCVLFPGNVTATAAGAVFGVFG